MFYQLFVIIVVVFGCDDRIVGFYDKELVVFLIKFQLVNGVFWDYYIVVIFKFYYVVYGFQLAGIFMDENVFVCICIFEKIIGYVFVGCSQDDFIIVIDEYWFVVFKVVFFWCYFKFFKVVVFELFVCYYFGCYGVRFVYLNDLCRCIYMVE